MILQVSLLWAIQFEKLGICSIDFNFNLSAVNDYGKRFTIVTGKDSFQVFSKICRWKQQTISPIGDSMESKVFDELLLIEIKITTAKLLEKIYGLLRKTLAVQTNTIKRRMIENDMQLVELKTGRANFKWQVLYIWRMIDQSQKITNFLIVSIWKIIILNQHIKPQRWSNCVIR